MTVKNVFTCSCDESKTFERTEFLKHLGEVHGIKKENVKGRKEMLMHMDGPKFYSSTYAWTLENGFKFTEFFESTRNRKTKLL